MNLVPNILGSLAVAAALLFARVRADDEVTLRLKGKGFSYSWGLSNYEFDLTLSVPSFKLETCACNPLPMDPDPPLHVSIRGRNTVGRY